VENADGMAVADGIEQLEEDVLDKNIVAEIPAMVQDLCKQIAVGAVVHDDERVTVVLDNAVQGDHVGMCRDTLVQGNLLLVQAPLS
jgi:hypothetical protein